MVKVLVEEGASDVTPLGSMDVGLDRHSSHASFNSFIAYRTLPY